MSQKSETNLRPLFGIGLKVTSISLFVTMMVAIKLVHDYVPIGQIIFTRAIIGVATVYLFYQLNNRSGVKDRLKIISYRAHVPWALSAASAMTMWFIAITLIPLPEATAIGFVMPLLVVAFAWALLGETIRIVRSLAIASGAYRGHHYCVAQTRPRCRLQFTRFNWRGTVTGCCNMLGLCTGPLKNII